MARLRPMDSLLGAPRLARDLQALQALLITYEQLAAGQCQRGPSSRPAPRSPVLANGLNPSAGLDQVQPMVFRPSPAAGRRQG